MSANPSERTRRIVEAIQCLEGAIEALRVAVPAGRYTKLELAKDIYYRAGFAQSSVEMAIDILRPCLRAKQQPAKRKRS